MGRQSTQYPTEVREHAIRLIFDHRGDCASQWEAISSIAAKIGCTAETLRRWVRQAERDSGAIRPDDGGWRADQGPGTGEPRAPAGQ